MSDRVTRITLDATKARADLATFGGDIDRLTAKLGGLTLEVRVGDSEIQHLIDTIDDIARTIEVDLAVDSADLESVLDRLDDSYTVDIAVDSAEIDRLLADLDGGLDLVVDVDPRELADAAERISSLARTVAVGLDVDETDIRQALDALTYIDGLVTQVGVDVVDDEIRQAIADLSDLAGSTVSVGVDVDETEILQAIDLVASFAGDVGVRIDVDSAELESAARAAAALDTTANLTVNVGGDIDAALRAAEGLNGTANLRVDVDDSEIDSALDKVAGLAAGGTFAAGFASGFGGALSLEQAVDKLDAQLGLTEEAAARSGEIAATVYGGAWGDSVEGVTEALKGVGTNLVDLNTTGSAEIENLTIRSLDLAAALDEDVGGITRTVGQLVRNGLAKDFDEAFDIIATGIQSGTNRGEDLLDTFNEYGSTFQGLGFDAGRALGVMNAGLDAGFDNTDRIADALREFQIRAVDGTAAAATGFDQLGFKAGELEAAIAAGGPAAEAAFDKVIDGLAGIEDPLARTTLQNQLFGAQLEDFGVDAVDVFGRTAVAIGDVSGAAEQLGTDLNDNAATNIESFKRTALLGLTEFVGNTVVPKLTEIGPSLIEGLSTAVGFFTSNILPSLQTAFAFISEQATLFFNAISTGQTEDEGSAIESLALFIRNDLVPALQSAYTVVVEDVLPAVGDLATTFIEDVLPVVADFATIVIEDVVPILADLVSVIANDVVPVVVEMTEAMRPVVEVVVAVIGAIVDLIVWLSEIGVLGEAVSFAFTVMFLPATIAIAIVSTLVSFLTTLWDALSNITAIGPVVSTAFDGIGAAIGSVGEFLGNLASTAGSVLAALPGLVSGALSAIAGFVADAGQQIGAIWSAAWDAVAAILSGALDGMTAVISGFGEVVTGLFRGAVDGVSSTVSSGFTLIQTTISSALSAASSVVSSVFNGIRSTVSSAMSAASSVVSSVLNGIRSTFASALSGVSSTVSSVFNGIRSTISSALSAASSVVSSALRGIQSVFSSAWSAITSSVRSASGAISGVIAGIRSAIKSLLSPINSAISAFNRLKSLGGSAGGLLSKINPFAAGGLIDRPTVALMGEVGRELVLPEYASTAYIKQLLAKTNILDRLEADFARAAAPAPFDAAAAARTARPSAGFAAPSSTYVDHSTVSILIEDRGQSAASKQLTAREVAARLAAERRQRRRLAGAGAGARWRDF